MLHVLLRIATLHGIGLRADVLANGAFRAGLRQNRFRILIVLINHRSLSLPLTILPSGPLFPVAWRK